MEPFSGYSSNATAQDHKNLTCFLCTRYYTSPRILPCHHVFCLSCIKTLCDKSKITNTTSPIKKKIVCPRCKARLSVPAGGVESFPLDHKTQSLTEQVIQELAQDISRSINNPKEETFSELTKNSPNGRKKLNHDNFRNSHQTASDIENLPSYNRGADSPSPSASLYGDFSKYAKYFNQDSNVDGDYKPTIKADHTRVGYESSTRFRNRRVNSRERQGSEEKEMRRRTWYGSTLQHRRAQSLNRASMFVGVDDKEKKSSENLFKISEDREQTTPGNASSNVPVFSSDLPFNKKPSVESQNKASYAPWYKNNEERFDYSRPKSANTSDFKFEASYGTGEPMSEKTQKRDFTPRSGLGGPTRITLPTHRENLVTDSFLRQKSKEKSPADESGTYVKSRQKTPWMEESNDRKQSPSVGSFTCFPKQSESPERQEPTRTFVGSRHNRFQRLRGVNDQNWKDDKKENEFISQSFGESTRAHRVTSRENLHLDIDNQEPQHKPKEQDSLLSHQDSSPRRSRSRKSHKARCRSVESKYSLNKNDFNSESEFRKHLLNMTMSKEKYQHMMEDFKKGQLINMRSDSIGGCDIDPDDVQSEVKVKMQEDKENVEIDPNKSDDGNKAFQKEVESPKPPKEPLIDENLIITFRTKYSSPLDIKRFPKQETYPEYCEGMLKRWSYQKNDYGIPTSAVFLSSGNLVVAEYGLSYLEFFDAGGHLEHNLTGIKPYGLTKSSLNQNIIVGDRKGKCIRIFDEYGADVSQIDNLGSIEWLAGMATRRDGGLILCDRGRCKILICNSAGEKIKEFGSFGSSAKQLCMADFLAVDSKNRILVADSGNHCVKVFDPDGTYLKVIGSRGSGDGQMEWPKGIAIDKDDNIIVADTLNHRISLYSPDGTFVKHLMTSIPDPYNITCSDGNLGVLHYNLRGMSQYDVYTYWNLVFCSAETCQ